MVHHGYWGEGAGQGLVKTSYYKYINLVHGVSCSEGPAESAGMRLTYVIHHANDVSSGGSETHMSRTFWIQMIIHRNGILAGKNDCMDVMHKCWAPNDYYYVSEVSSKVSVNGVSMIFGIASWKIQMVSLERSFIIELYPACLFKNCGAKVATMSEKWASTECQQLLAFHLRKCKGCAGWLR